MKLRLNFKYLLRQFRKEKIIVPISAATIKVAQDYLKDARDQARAAQEALLAGDFETLKNIGDSMKGNGGSFGFDLITKYGQTLGDAAKAQEATAIETTIHALSDYLDRVKVVLKT
ncbi:MAG: Hpt domain-containing protein [Elusimicrobiota bacterium]